MADPDYADRARSFVALHRGPGAFVLPNAWDAGSAKVLATAGFGAIGTTSAGIAFAAGRPDDGSIGRETMLTRIGEIVAAIPKIPVSADIEAGYAENAEGVAETIRQVIDLGAVGVNLEDVDSSSTSGMFEPEEGAERVAAARAAADAEGVPFTLNARVDSFLAGAPDPFEDAEHRSRLYVEAGADCIFIPGIETESEIAQAVKMLDAPLNVVAGLSGEPLDLATYESLGVRRVSIGGSLARAALGFVRRAAAALSAGRFSHAAEAIPHGELNVLMGA